MGTGYKYCSINSVTNPIFVLHKTVDRAKRIGDDIWDYGQ